MTKDDILRMAEEAGIIAWAKHEWNPKTGAFTHSDDGLDGDEACLMQFAELVLAAKREACESCGWLCFTAPPSELGETHER